MKRKPKKSRSRSEKAQKRYAREGRGPEKGGRRGNHKKHAAGRGGQSKAAGAKRTYIGRVQKNPRGFAFLLPVGNGFADVYVGPREAATLMSGDKVEFSIVSRGRRSEARIEHILERGQKEILGRVEEGQRGFVLTTETGDIHELDRARPKDVGQWVIGTIEEYPTDRHPGLVSIKEPLGRELTPRHDIPIAISRYGLSEEFSLDAKLVANHARNRALEEMHDPAAHRRDQRDLPYVTIDGEDAKDFDDAVLVEATKGGAGFVLYVAIADVSFFVETGSALDEDARKRGTSVYFPGYCLPMLPESLSNDMCSLRPQTDKLAFTAEIHFDRDGMATKSRFYKSIIRTARRLTYTQVQGYLDRKEPYHADLKPLAPQLDAAEALYRKLARRRTTRGVLDFDLPECKVQTDEAGTPVSVRRAERHDSHKLIEEFMITANRAVAKALRDANELTLYRVHEPPDIAALDELNTTLKNLGVPDRVKEISPKEFARILEATKLLPAAPTLHQVILRLQKQAHYEPEPKGHFGLALKDYTHFTSPIRRYPDLVVHRSLKTLLDGHQTREPVENYEDLGDRTSQSERRAMEAERFLLKRKQCWYMQKHLGQRFEGRIASVTENGLFVEIPQFAIDGFVPLEFLRGDYQLDERHMCLRRRPGNFLLKVGDPLEIEVVKVSVDENQITFGAIDG